MKQDRKSIRSIFTDALEQSRPDDDRVLVAVGFEIFLHTSTGECSVLAMYDESLQQMW